MRGLSSLRTRQSSDSSWQRRDGWACCWGGDIVSGTGKVIGPAPCWIVLSPREIPEESRGACFIIAESVDGSSTTVKVLCGAWQTQQKNTEQYGTKKCPPTEDGHNPRSGQETLNSVRCAAEGAPSAITHIGCVYADEPSIGSGCDLDMTGIKPAHGKSKTSSGEAGPAKKKPARGGLKTIFLEENSGDRCSMLQCDRSVQFHF